MMFLIDTINTVIQVFIIAYFPYYFLISNKEIDEQYGKKKFIITGISMFIVSFLSTYMYNNSNLTATLITILCLIIIWIVYISVYKKALVAYSIAYILIQLIAILVTSITWPLVNTIVHNNELSRLLGIYIPAILLEFVVIKSKDRIKPIYDYLSRSKNSLEIGFILIISMDFIICLSMMVNSWSYVISSNFLILLAVVFLVGICIYSNNIDNKYKEIDNLNKLLIDKNNELKKIKHDYGSQISYINGLYLMKQYDRLGEMLNDIIHGNNQILSNIKYITNRGSVISSVAESLDLGDIHLVIDEEYDSDLINMSSYDLHKILSNILSNAIDALDGNGLIIIKTYKLFNSVYICIKNNGPKIESSIIEDIFNKGFTTKDDKNNDHGYGLCIVNEIVSKNNGKLHVSSDEKYTEFKIVLLEQNDSI
ncbi:MAG: sensor histidine kinase [Romboutsia sp.]|uniref:sensor histidine kinase n=1 Tax=Romboutsia sp. TaxID=1965302 RepID=UPI003F392918